MPLEHRQSNCGRTADEAAPREALRGAFYALIEARKSSTKIQLRCEKLNYFVKRYQTAKLKKP